MAKFKRNPLPKKIVWRQASTTHDRFYWLAVDKDQRKNGSVVVAVRDGNKVNLSKMERVSRVTIRFNDEMVDMGKAIKVAGPDGIEKEVKVNRTINTIFKCLSERVDPGAIFYGELAVESKQKESNEK